MHPLTRQTREETKSETSRNDSEDCSSVVFERKGKAEKRKLDVANSPELPFADQSKKCRLDELTAMEGSSSSAQSPTPSNGIIRPINNQMKTNMASTNHFHHAGKGSNIAGYGAKPSQAKKLVIKNFKGECEGCCLKKIAR